MNTNIELPPDFEVTSDYDSHRPLLYLALQRVPRGTVAEFGCGEGSTPPLAGLCEQQNRVFLSFETKEEWAIKFPETTTLISSYEDVFDSKKIDRLAILFIDSAPGEDRLFHIDLWEDYADVIIIHDTEPGAEYVYGLSGILRGFQYRVDLEIAGHPRTTAVSNTIDVREWKKYTVGGYKLI